MRQIRAFNRITSGKMAGIRRQARDVIRLQAPSWKWFGGVLLVLTLLLAACTTPPAPTATVPATARPPTATVGVPVDVPTAAPVVTARPPANPTARASRLTIPALQLDVPVVDVGWQIVTHATGQRTTEWEIAVNAAGHHLNSAAPGTAGNVVISGHNNTGGAVFAAISRDRDQPAPQLVPGSMITVFADDGQQYDYQVNKVDLVAEENVPLAQRLANARYLEPTREPTLTLITCWPPDGFSHRIIVVASLSD